MRRRRRARPDGSLANRHPVAHVQWVPIEKVKANDWNPNRVAPVEMHLLYLSIKADGYCVEASTPILCADLNWRPAGGLEVGEAVIAFDAEVKGQGRARCYRTGLVTHNKIRDDELYRVATDRGEILTNADHPWLAQRMYGNSKERQPRWISTRDLQADDLLVYVAEPWQRDKSWEAGWLAGFLDGEGTIDGFRLAGYQRPSTTADRMIEAVTSRVGATIHTHVHENPKWHDLTMVRVNRMKDTMRLLGTVRPERLIEMGGEFWRGVSMIQHGSAERARVLYKRREGQGQIASLATSTQTYVAAGFAMHNTQPVVAIHDEEQDEYIVVDGFHRYRTMLEHKDIRESTGGLLPVVVISGGPNELRASTIRHNRARGKHGIANMAQIVFDMLDNGWTETEVCRELGMSADEIVRLKHVTGFAKLFEGVDYRRAWETKRMAKLRREWQAEHPGEPMP